ncbi:PH domain-containing protein [Aestuariibaculum marinum]|uniref:PH domain-containing protein n=1 Tax=Aestuariibaculum marinum TaxID=2683592 RepID=A0A8J6U4S7_9FLAO|nr:PH domain-containing protein [Aestuariibaculum marinum]MBD0824262.1 PH domain-containing protein [Aestuariibaculum marinum]
MKFKSRKEPLFTTLIFSIIGIICIHIFLSNDYDTSYTFKWLDLILVLVIGLLLWIHFGTSYKLTEKELKYKSGPIFGSIIIANIHEIVKGKTLWVGIKPATAPDGLIIKYNKYEEIYISPKTNESFIKKILELNSDIKITT